MNNSILICGVGGQGTVLASKIIASTALDMGLPVIASETIGMAQRGGCVVSHVRVGEDIFSPLIPKGKADAVIAFEPSEAVRCAGYLKQGGVMVVSNRPVQPVTSSLTGKAYDVEAMLDYLKTNVPGCIIVNGEELCSKIGMDKALNIALIGVLCGSKKSFLSLENVETTIKNTMPQKIVDINIKALNTGAEIMEAVK